VCAGNTVAGSPKIPKGFLVREPVQRKDPERIGGEIAGNYNAKKGANVWDPAPDCELSTSKRLLQQKKTVEERETRGKRTKRGMDRKGQGPDGKNLSKASNELALAQHVEKEAESRMPHAFTERSYQWEKGISSAIKDLEVSIADLEDENLFIRRWGEEKGRSNDGRRKGGRGGRARLQELIPTVGNYFPVRRSGRNWTAARQKRQPNRHHWRKRRDY